MLTANDLGLIKEIFKEEIKIALDENNKMLFKKLVTKSHLEKKLKETENNIYIQVGDFLVSQVISQLEQKANKKDVEEIKRKLNLNF